jgi:AraC-like DNA-binding protein
MSEPFPFDFKSKPPTPQLGRYVESIWYARGTVPYAREKIAPTGSTVVVFVLGDPILETAADGEGESVLADRGFIIGPHDRPVVNEPTGETHAVGIVCTPIGAGPALGVRPPMLRGRVLHLHKGWPRGSSLRKRLVETGSPDKMIELVEAALLDGLGTEGSNIGRCEQAVKLLEKDPTIAIAEVAAEVGVSHAHLDREFTAVVGITPRALSRLLRMRGLLRALDVRADVEWAALAMAWGWYDQAHLIRDFKRHTGVTPTRYLEAQRATYSPVDHAEAAGFVPEM